MDKAILKTKTFWGGIASVATGVSLIIQGDLGNGITTIVLGTLAIFGRDAISGIEKK
jgi:hypothetical protein